MASPSSSPEPELKPESELGSEPKLESGHTQASLQSSLLRRLQLCKSLRLLAIRINAQIAHLNRLFFFSSHFRTQEANPKPPASPPQPPTSTPSSAPSTTPSTFSPTLLFASSHAPPSSPSQPSSPQPELPSVSSVSSPSTPGLSPLSPPHPRTHFHAQFSKPRF